MDVGDYKMWEPEAAEADRERLGEEIEDARQERLEREQIEREALDAAEARGAAVEAARWKARIEKLAKVEDRGVEFCRVVNGNRSKAAVHKGRARLLRSLLNDSEGADHE